jgi:SAM-dependent methyltransferase
LTAADLAEYYNQQYYSGGLSKGYSDYLGGRESRKSHYRSLLATIRGHLPTDEVRALDVGCAAGFFLEVAQEAGWCAEGVEFSAYMSEYAREELHLNVQTGTIEDADLPDGAFNLITMWDVIEHLTDPKRALRRASRLLKAGGIIAISTGDISGATARIYGRRWDLLAPPGHLFYFSRKTLFAMLRQTGFEPLECHSDGGFLINDALAEKGGILGSTLIWLHHRRYVNAALRRLKLGSIMTVYARRCGIS